MSQSVTAFVASLEVPATTASQLITQIQANPAISNLTSSTITPIPALLPLTCWVLNIILASGEVTFPPADRALVEVNWSETCWLSPQCVVSPRSPNDVSLIMKTVSFLRSSFSVRSGGHSPNPGFASNNGGLLIDLGPLNQTTVSANGKTISVGPGNRWGAVYQALDPYGVTAIGTRIPAVGVGGSILGGGLSVFSGQYGLAADNVNNFQIVLANGTITNANTGQNSDLFWALKGGGPNFGIVTSFDLNTIPVRNIWYTASLYAPSSVPAVLQAFAQWETQGALDLKSSVVIQVGTYVSSVVLVYSEPASNPAAFAPFYSVPPLSTPVPPVNSTALALANLLQSFQPNVPMRDDNRGTATLVDATLYTDVASYFQQEATAALAYGANLTLIWKHVPQNLVEVGIQNGGNPLGLTAVAQQWTTIEGVWTASANDAAVENILVSIGTEFQTVGAQRGTFLSFEYMNDAAADQDPLRSYGVANLEQLTTISEKYDPARVFQILQYDGFLVSKA